MGGGPSLFRTFSRGGTSLRLHSQQVVVFGPDPPCACGCGSSSPQPGRWLSLVGRVEFLAWQELHCGRLQGRLRVSGIPTRSLLYCPSRCHQVATDSSPAAHLAGFLAREGPSEVWPALWGEGSKPLLPCLRWWMCSRCCLLLALLCLTS